MFVQLRVWVFAATHHLWRNLAANLTVCWLYQTHSFLVRMNLTITANLETRYDITFMQHLDFIHRVHSCKVLSYSHTFTRLCYIYIYTNVFIPCHKKMYIYQYTDARSFIGVFCCLFTLTNGLVHFSTWVNPNWWWLSRFELCLGCTGCNL